MPTARVCLQWMEIIFNTLTLMLGVPALLFTIYKLLSNYDDGWMKHIDIFVQLAAAGILILAAIVGCTGAFIGSKCVLLSHIFLFFVLIIYHIFKLVQYNETKHLDETALFVTNMWMQDLGHRGMMNQLQKSYKCCGYWHSSDYTSGGQEVPLSCFHTQDDLRAVYPYVEGCLVAVKRAYLQFYRYEMWTHCGLIAYEILGIVLAITLCCQLTNKPRRYAY